MFPVFAIESAYQDHWSPDWKPALNEFLQIGSLCEQWLLSYTGSDPFNQAVDALTQQSRKGVDKRMYFAVAMALCAPSPHTAELIGRYREHILANGYDIGVNVGAISKLMDSQRPVDLMEIFRSLPREHYQAAAKGYHIALASLKANAVAWDDLEVFKKCIKEGSADSFAPLASFPVDPCTRIHQFMMGFDNADQDLLYHQMSALRDQITDEYTHGTLYRRCEGEPRITLRPGDGISLERATLGGTVPVHKQPGFAERLMKNPARHTKLFFEPLGQWKSQVNQGVADEVTQAFLDAGVPPLMIMTQGVGEWDDSMPPTSLYESLRALKSMSGHDRQFYKVAYRAYLKDFSAKELIEHSEDPETVGLVYGITGDKALMQAGGEQVRSHLMGADLGL